MFLCLANIKHVYPTHMLDMKNVTHVLSTWIEVDLINYHTRADIHCKRIGLSIFTHIAFCFRYKCNRTKGCIVQNLCADKVSFEQHVCFDVVA